MIEPESTTHAGQQPEQSTPPTQLDLQAALAAVVASMPTTGRWLAVRVAAHIVARATRRGGEVAISQQMIAREMGIELVRVRKAIEQVRKMPALELTASRGRTGVWRLRIGGGRT